MSGPVDPGADSDHTVDLDLDTTIDPNPPDLGRSLMEVTQTVQSLALSVQQLVQGQLAQHQRPANNPPTVKPVPWSLIKTLCPEKLDIDTMSAREQKSWHRKFNAFSTEAKLDTRDWEIQKTALETTMKATTFTKVDALRLQLPADKREKIKDVLEMTENLIDGEQSKWAKRYEFHRLEQKSDQTARSFFAEAVEISGECEFGDTFCHDCKQKASDQMVLMKVVFGNASEDARRKMLKTTELDAEKARKILEDDEILKKTEKTLDSQKMPEVAAMSRGREHSQSQNTKTRPNRSASRSRGRNDQSNDKCGNCGYHHYRQGSCPAKGQQCRKCKKYNHYGSMCRGQRQFTQQNRSSPNRQNQSLGIVCKISSKVDTVEIRLDGEFASHEIKAIMDTGSDWNCLPSSEVEKFKEDLHNLYPPTDEMASTINANGENMKVVGYIKADVAFGDRKIPDQELVVFEGVRDYILSKDSLLKLGIVQFNLTPSSQKVATTRTKPPLPPKPPAPAYLTERRPADERPVPKPRTPHKPLTREAVLEEYSDVFAHHTTPMKGEDFTIELEANAIPCRVHHVRNIPLQMKDKLKAELDSLEQAGHISKVTKPTDWCHPIVVAPKKDSSSIRLCIDFRQLNKYCKREYFDSPSVIETVQSINDAEAQLFSKFDAKKGYHQISLSETSKDLTCFMTPFGRYRFERAPFGVNSIPEHFNRRMFEILEGIDNHARIVDDCLIYGKTADEHDARVRAFLQRCRDHNVQLNPDKVEFQKPEVVFGGMVVSANGYSPQKRIIEAVTEFPEPTTYTEMKRFHGYVNQLAPFDELITKKMDPLRHLLKKESKNDFCVTEDDRKAFHDLKSQLTDPRVLAYFIPGRPIQVFTDASSYGYGFVIKQLQRDGKTWKPIMCRSRTLTDAETRYCPIESEMNALRWALTTARSYLIGGPRFTVYTDHQPLVTLINKRRLDEVHNQRLLNNLIKLTLFSFEVKYIKGHENQISDALSRAPVGKPENEDVLETEDSDYCVRIMTRSMHEESELTLPLQKIRDAATDDPEYRALMTTIQEGFPDAKNKLNPDIQSYWNVRDDLSISDDGFILRGVRLVIPKSQRRDVLDEVHAGHRGIELTKARARFIVYWPGIDQQIEQLCKSCDKCSYDRPTQRDEPQKHFPTPSRAFEFISADFAQVDTLKFLVITDWKTGWFATTEMKKTDASAVIQTLRKFFAETAVPVKLFSDNGPPFGSVELNDFLNRWGVRWESSSPYHARSNSFAENGVKSAKSLLSKCVSNGKIDYEAWHRGLLSIRNTPHKDSGLSPAILLYGHSVNDTVPAHKSCLSKSWHSELSDFDRKIARERQKQDHYKPGRSLPELRIGDPVVIQNRTSKKWDKYGVIQERNLNLRRYTIRLPSGMITIRNRIDLRKRYPKPDAASGTETWKPFAKNELCDEPKSILKNIPSDSRESQRPTRNRKAPVRFEAGS